MAKLKIAVTGESTIDLPRELLEQYEITVLPYTIALNSEEFTDGDISNEEFFKLINAAGTLPKTQAINQFRYEEFFRETLKTHDAIIHFCLSSGLSSSCNNATVASKNFENVHVVDSLALSTGIALLAFKAVEAVREGKEFEDIVKYIDKLIPTVQTSFLIEKTNYLYKGGRCSLLSFIAASVLNIKPQIVMKNGKLEPGKKYRGSYEKSIIKYVEDTLEEFKNPDLDLVFITCTTSPQEVIDQIECILKERGFKNIYKTRAGCTISSHCGPNTLGILYFNKN